jgi:hypothetical protein
MYVDVVRCVFGLTDEALEDMQRIIHGSLTPKGVRIPYTGIKHSLVNMIRLCGQAEFFDMQPCVIIVPIMTLKQMRDWNLDEYNAIVLAGASGRFSAPMAYRGIQLRQFGECATTDEIEIASTSLGIVLQGLAYSLDERQAQRQEATLQLKGKLASFREGLQNSEVIVPMPSLDSNLRVRKVSFQAHRPHANAHPAPDPLFLFIKSAINWARRNGQPLLDDQ